MSFLSSSVLIIYPLQVLPGNRYAATYVMEAVCDSIIDKLALNPLSEYDTPSIAPELHKLVKNKILDQDPKIRQDLKSLKYSLDESTTGILFRDQNLEQASSINLFLRQ